MVKKNPQNPDEIGHLYLPASQALSQSCQRPFNKKCWGFQPQQRVKWVLCLQAVTGRIPWLYEVKQENYYYPSGSQKWKFCCSNLYTCLRVAARRSSFQEPIGLFMPADYSPAPLTAFLYPAAAGTHNFKRLWGLCWRTRLRRMLHPG